MPKSICLHDYQNEIKLRLAEEWQTHRSVLVQMPTGTGKTHVLAAIVREERRGKREESNSNETCVWIIAHRRELVAQIEETLERYEIKAEDGREDKGKGQIKVMSIQWLSKHWEDVRREPELIVIDEAHHAQAKTYRMLWDKCPKARFLGLTATPCRMNRRGFTDLFDTLICSWSIAEFIDKGYLSPFDYVSIRQGSEEQRLISSLEKRGADGDYQIKEMDSVLNRNTSISRLYRSMELFADGKKGIVYAISIDHARRIAEYYNRQGVNAVPIDSKTPMTERKRMVEDFRAGRIKVLVNVDIFSEGFDCPDVEFVQMARPTLSLAKYLQQIGRGLRKTEYKEACVLIDNVGLYRVFGLPTVAWDWQAMFHGITQGKGHPAVEDTRNRRILSESAYEDVTQECNMEVIVSHESLLAEIAERNAFSNASAQKKYELKAWQDKNSGLWGLRYGNQLITNAIFTNVFDIKYGMAAVGFKDKDCGIVNDAGEVVWKKNGCQSIKLLKNGLLHVMAHHKEYYVDMYSLHTFVRKPKVRRYGNVELLETGHVHYSRTRTIYVSNQNVGKEFIHWRGFYLTIYDEKVPYPNYYKENQSSEYSSGFACILEGDHDNYYWLYYRLADGSIIVTDNTRKYYHVAEGKQKIYIGCRDSEDEWGRCRAKIERMAEHAEKKRHILESERTEKRRQFLSQSDEAVPFQSGMRWGLRVGSRVTVPPIYRNVKSPIGKYCAVERNYNQWGVVALDGTMMVEPKYSDIEINTHGIVTGTKVTGNKEQMKLP